MIFASRKKNVEPSNRKCLLAVRNHCILEIFYMLQFLHHLFTFPYFEFLITEIVSRYIHCTVLVNLSISLYI